MAEHGRLLVVDDDPDVREAVSRALRLQGYEVFTASDGGQALAAVTEVHPEALVLDVLMPFVDGLEVCRRLRAQRDRSPILVLTARDGVADRIAGLDAGADDYLVKPFALGELLARVRALLRRVRLEDNDTLRFGDLVLDPETRQARRGSRVIELTHTEYTLLELFVQNAGAVLTHEIILDRIWGHRFSPETNSLQVFVHYLRRKTEAGGEPRLVHTVRGLGYTLREP